MINLFFIFLGILVTIVFIVAALWTIGKFFLPNFSEQWRLLGNDLGLENRNPEGLYPDLYGRINRVDVVVDVVHQSYMTTYSSRVGSSTRPWLRVRVQLDETPPFQIRSRRYKLPQTPEFPSRKTGDATFDQKYELFAPEDVNLEDIIPRPVWDELLVANPSVNVLNNVVVWMERGFNKNPQLIKRAVASCVDVAAAFSYEAHMG